MSFAPRSLASIKGVRCAHSRLSLASRIDVEPTRSFTLPPLSRRLSTAQPSRPSPCQAYSIRNSSSISPLRSPVLTEQKTVGLASRSFASSSSNAASSSSTGPVEEEYTNPYKAKRIWPPDMSKLSPKQQFRLERKYRRRSKLKWARPAWTKWTKLVQWGLIGFVLVYSVLFMEIKDSGTNPFQGLREYLKGLFDDSVLSGRRPALRNESTSPAEKTERQ